MIEADRPPHSAVYSRVIAAALVVAVLVLAALLLFGGSDSHRYRLVFEDAGQLVVGNQVQVGGSPFGEVESIELTEDNEAAVEVSVQEPLREGTSATIRATSLSGVANRYIALSLGPNNAPDLPEGATIGRDHTTAAVDLDQLFNTFDPETRRGLSQLIQGFAGIYAGRGEDANQAYRYFPATLTATDRLLEELGRDQQLLTRFLVDGSRVIDAIAAEKDRLASAVANTGAAMTAIAAENSAFGRSLELLPPTLREANTTFVNLRAALDDLDPLVETSLVATRDLEPFLARLRPFARRSVPVFTNLARATNRPGADNDLADLARNASVLHRRGEPASRASVRAMDASQEMVSVARAYSPDLTGAISRLSAVTGYYDANGNYARAAAVALNLFERDPATGNLIPTTPGEKFDSLSFESPQRRCPGGAIQAIPGSNPFLDQGRLGLDTCDPSDLPPG